MEVPEGADQKLRRGNGGSDVSAHSAERRVEGRLRSGKKAAPPRRVLLWTRIGFGGTLDTAALQPEFYDKAFSRVTLPHCVIPLSWQIGVGPVGSTSGFTAAVFCCHASSADIEYF
jgi:hypothetical protein